MNYRNNLNSHVMSNLALQAASSTTAPSYAFPGTADTLNGIDNHSAAPVTSLRSSRGNSHTIAKGSYESISDLSAVLQRLRVIEIIFVTSN